MPDTAPSHDAELLADVAAPAETFAEFYRLHVDGLLKWCAQRGLSASDAADVTAETFIVALYRRAEFEGSLSPNGSAEPWLQRIAFNIVARRHRSSERERRAHRRWAESFGSLTERDAAEYAALREQARETLEWVAGLVPAQHQALIGREIHGKPYPQLADELSVSEETVRQRVSRAIAVLRQRRSPGDEA